MNKTQTLWYWVAIVLAIGAFIFCMALTEVYGWRLSEYCWLLKGVMLSVALVLVVGVWQKQKATAVVYAWPLSVAGLVIAVWHYFVPQTTCTLDCDRALFMLGSFGVTPTVLAMTLFALLTIILGQMWLQKKR